MAKRTAQADERAAFAQLAADLAGPLAKFLDHPYVREDIAGRITDALMELADFKRPPTTNGRLSADALNDIADHHPE